MLHTAKTLVAILLLALLAVQCQSSGEEPKELAVTSPEPAGQSQIKEPRPAAPEVGAQKPTTEGEELPIAQLEFRTENGAERVYHNGQPFTGLGYSEFGNGNRFTEQAYVDGIQNGYWAVYFEYGKRQKEGSKLNAVDHDVYHEWYESGALKYEYHYDAGLKIGVWKSWYENGQQWTERHWENDTLHGPVLVWDTDGTLTKKYVYVKGQQVSAEQYLED